MQNYLNAHPNSLALFALLLFVGLASLVVLYIATDRRKAHHRRMESMALDDDNQQKGTPHV
jgi:cbb3-type cytochrome oxidase subunit 3